MTNINSRKFINNDKFKEIEKEEHKGKDKYDFNLIVSCMRFTLHSNFSTLSILMENIINENSLIRIFYNFKQNSHQIEEDVNRLTIMFPHFKVTN